MEEMDNEASYTQRKRAAFRRVGEGAHYSLSDVLGNVFQPYYMNYEFIYLAVDNQKIPNVESYDDISEKEIVVFPVKKREDIISDREPRKDEKTPINENMGSEVLLESRSPDMEDIAYTSEWLKQNTNIHGWLSFFIFSLTLGGLVSAIFPIVTYNSEDYGGSICLGVSDVVSGFMMLGIAMYTIYLFVSRKPNAVFWGISYVIIIFLSNVLSLIDSEEATGFLSTRSIGHRLVWGVIWLLYLIFSEQVKEVIPKKFRKVSKWDVGILAVTILIPIMLFVIGISQIAFLSVKQERQENELLHRELSDNERTDGRVVFKIPDGFACDSQEVNVNGSPITLFIIHVFA